MKRTDWTFLSNHGRIFAYLAKHQKVTMQALAFKTGLSIRAVHDIVDDLEERGYITREKTGRANRYQVNLEKPMRHGMEKKVSVGSLVQALNTRIRNYGGGSKIDRIVVAVKSKNES